MNTCDTCLYWTNLHARYGSDKLVGDCRKMADCFCCSTDKTQIAGAVGGSHLESYGEFGCVLWRIDSRNKNHEPNTIL